MGSRAFVTDAVELTVLGLLLASVNVNVGAVPEKFRNVITVPDPVIFTGVGKFKSLKPVPVWIYAPKEIVPVPVPTGVSIKSEEVWVNVPNTVKLPIGLYVAFAAAFDLLKVTLPLNVLFAVRI